MLQPMSRVIIAMLALTGRVMSDFRQTDPDFSALDL
jgi:hypothetical protein